jgi:type I restriction enzyme S subunit
MEQVRKGYKKTEVGILPNEWSLVSFKDCSFMKGRIGWQGLKETEFTNNPDQPFLITGMNFKDGEIRWDEVYHVSEERYELAKEIQLREGDVLMTKDGTIGKLLFVDSVPYPHKATLNSHLLVFRPIKSCYYPKYLYYNLSSPYFYRHIELNKSGTTFFGISQESVGKYFLILPPLLEQKAIATALSDVDELITKLEKLIEKKKAIKQGAMQKLLTPPHKGGKRLKGFSGEWERVQLSRVISVARGGSPRPIQDFITTKSSGVNWIKIGDTSPNSKFITSSVEKIVPEGAQFSRKVCSGDFLLSNSMSFGRPYILKIDGCIHDGWLVLQNYQDSFDTEFLYYTLMSNDVFNQYLMKASGSSVLNLNKEIVKTVELNRPMDLNEQRAIAEILKEMDEEIALWESQKEKCKTLKQGMMQELLTGKTRLV